MVRVFKCISLSLKCVWEHVSKSLYIFPCPAQEGKEFLEREKAKEDKEETEEAK